MRVLFQLAFNNIRKYKRESFLVVMSISLTISLITVALIVMTSLFATTVNEYVGSWPFNVSISGVKNPHKLIEDLGPENIEYYEVVRNDKEYYITTNEGVTGVSVIETYGKLDDTDYSADTIVSGRNAERNNEIVVTQSLGFKLGDYITIDSSRDDIDSIQAIVVGTSSYGVSRIFDDSPLVVKEGRGADVSIVFNKNERKIVDLVDSTINENTYFDDYYINYNNDYNFLKGFQSVPGQSVYLYTIMGLILVFVIALMTFTLILNAFDTSLTPKNQSLGILKTVGATRRQMKVMILFEMMILTIIALIIGMLIGTGFAAILIDYLKSVVTSIDHLSIGYAIEDKIIYFAPVLIYGVVAAVSFIIIYFAIIIKTRELFKSQSISNQINIELKTKKHFSIKGDPVKSMARITTKRSKSYRGIKVALFVSTSVLIVISTMIGIFMQVPGNLMSSYDSTIMGNVDEEANIEDETLKIKEVLSGFDSINDSLFLYELEMMMIDYDKHVAKDNADVNFFSTDGIRVNVVEDESFETLIKLQGGEESMNSFFVNYIKVYEPNLNDHRLREEVSLDLEDGDVLYLNKHSAQAEKLIPYPLVVDKIVVNMVEPAEKGSNLYIKESYYDEFLKKDLAINSITVRLDTDFDADDLIEFNKMIGEITGTYAYQSFSDIGSQYIAKIVNDASVKISTLIFLYIGVVIVINIANVSLTNYRRRKKEVATLRSVGASSRQVLKMFFYETLLAVFKPWLFAIIFANISSFVMYKMYIKDLQYVEIPVFRVDIISNVVTILLILIILMIVMISVMIENRKSNIIEDITSY